MNGNASRRQVMALQGREINQLLLQLPRDALFSKTLARGVQCARVRVCVGNSLDVTCERYVVCSLLFVFLCLIDEHGIVSLDRQRVFSLFRRVWLEFSRAG